MTLLESISGTQYMNVWGEESLAYDWFLQIGFALKQTLKLKQQ